MRKLTAFILLTLFGLIILSSGCVISGYTASVKKFANSDVFKNLDVNLNFDYTKTYTTYGLVCEKGVRHGGGILDKIKQFLFDPKIKVCELKPLSRSELNDIGTDPSKKKFARMLEIGLGPTYEDFYYGVRYCGNYPKYAVITVEGYPGMGYMYGMRIDINNNVAYSAMANRVGCLLDHSILPVFVFTTPDGHPVDPDAPGIGNTLEQFGTDVEYYDRTVLVVYMLNPELSTNPTQQRAEIQLIKDNIHSIKQYCVDDNGKQHCIVGLGIKFQNASDLDNDPLMLELSRDFGFDSDVDFIAFGVDKRFVNASSGGELFSKALELSAKIMEKYGKPTFWVYTYLDGMSDTDKRMFYLNFFSQSRVLSSIGLLGFVPEPFFDFSSSIITREPDFNVEDGLASGSLVSGPKSFNDDAASFFLSYCRNYYESGNIPLIFYSNSGLGIMSAMAFSPPPSIMGTETYPEMLKPLYTVDVNEPDRLIIDCPVCPQTVVATNEEPLKSLRSINSFNSDVCKSDLMNYIKRFSSTFLTDSSFMLALALADITHPRFTHVSPTGAGRSIDRCDITPCSASLFSRDSYYMPFDSSSLDLLSQVDPGCFSGQSISWNFKEDSDVDDDVYWASCTPSNSQQSSGTCGICGYGVFHLRYAPGKWYTQNNKPMPPAVKMCGGENFNPFDLGMATCAAAYDVRDAIRAASLFVNNNYRKLGIGDPSGGQSSLSDEDIRKAYMYTLFFASMYYRGDSAGPGAVLDYFDSFRDEFKDIFDEDRSWTCDDLSRSKRVCCVNDNGEWKKVRGVCTKDTYDNLLLFAYEVDEKKPEIARDGFYDFSKNTGYDAAYAVRVMRYYKTISNSQRCTDCTYNIDSEKEMCCKLLEEADWDPSNLPPDVRSVCSQYVNQCN